MGTRKIHYLLMLLVTVLAGNLMILAAYWKSKWLPQPDRATVPHLHRWLVATDFSAEPAKFRREFAQRLEYEMDRPFDEIESLDLLSDAEYSRVRANLNCLVLDRLRNQRDRYSAIPSARGDELLRRSWRWNLKWLVYRTRLLGPNVVGAARPNLEATSDVDRELEPSLQEFVEQVFRYALIQECFADFVVQEQPGRAVVLKHLLDQASEALRKGPDEYLASPSGNLFNNLETLLRHWCRQNAARVHCPMSNTEQKELSAQLPRLEILLVTLSAQANGDPVGGLAETWDRVFPESEAWTPEEIMLIQFVRTKLANKNHNDQLGKNCG